MWSVRLADYTDLPDIERLAFSGDPPLTNLPAHRDRLQEMIALTRASVRRDVAQPGDETYVFVLENTRTREVCGTASIRALSGGRSAYYTYRQETLIHASHQMDVRQEVQTLSFSHELSEATQLCALHVDDRARGSSGERLLRRARLMFIAQFRERFADRLFVAYPGYLNASGEPPFWNGVGRHFIDLDFAEVNRLVGMVGKSFIAEAMPPYPLYLNLLSPEACAAIGRVHGGFMSPCDELRAEGMQPGRHIDVFDGGPILEADIDQMQTPSRCSWHPIRIREAQRLPDAAPALVANQGLAGFRCVLARSALSATGQLQLSLPQAECLGVGEGRAVLMAPLELPQLDEDMM